MIRRRRRQGDKASPDLTPMIDVTFQLLIFFIICTRFKVPERSHQAELPLEDGVLNRHTSIPKEQVTIYCNYDPATGSNDFVLAIGSRGRKPVLGASARLDELVIFENDGRDTIQAKRARYTRIHEVLVQAIKDYARDSGAKIEKLEISFARDATQGAASGTAPWMFVSTAIDAAAGINKQREKAGQPLYPVTFKFVDALGKYR